MGLLDNESIPRRKMTLFFVIDTSGSMVGSKIGSVNDVEEQRREKMAAFIYNTERLFGMEKGSLQEAIMEIFAAIRLD